PCGALASRPKGIKTPSLDPLWPAADHHRIDSNESAHICGTGHQIIEGGKGASAKKLKSTVWPPPALSLLFHVRQEPPCPARACHRRKPAHRRAPRKAQGPAGSPAARQGRRLPERFQARPPCGRPAR